eukprot:COSAG02_NODE_5682_length_4131_cov_2.988591_6_plen_112_part_00
MSQWQPCTIHFGQFIDTPRALRLLLGRAQGLSPLQILLASGMASGMAAVASAVNVVGWKVPVVANVVGWKVVRAVRVVRVEKVVVGVGLMTMSGLTNKSPSFPRSNLHNSC